MKPSDNNNIPLSIISSGKGQSGKKPYYQVKEALKGLLQTDKVV